MIADHVLNAEMDRNLVPHYQWVCSSCGSVLN